MITPELRRSLAVQLVLSPPTQIPRLVMGMAAQVMALDLPLPPNLPVHQGLIRLLKPIPPILVYFLPLLVVIRLVTQGPIHILLQAIHKHQAQTLKH